MTPRFACLMSPPWLSLFYALASDGWRLATALDALLQSREHAQHFDERRAVVVGKPVLVGGLLKLGPQRAHEHRRAVALALLEREARVLERGLHLPLRREVRVQ